MKDTYPSHPAPGEHFLSGNLVMETGCKSSPAAGVVHSPQVVNRVVDRMLSREYAPPWSYVYIHISI